MLSLDIQTTIPYYIFVADVLVLFEKFRKVVN